MTLRIAIMAHMFHADQFQHFRSIFAMMPDADLFLTTIKDERVGALKAAFTGWHTKVTIVPVANRGRDIAAKLIALARYHERYDVVLHVHTKGSSAHWRKHILKRLVGSHRQIRRILRMFERDPSLGMVGPEYYPPSLPWINWSENRAIAEDLMARIGVNAAGVQELEFPAGSMFWARPAALRPLMDLHLGFADFPEEPVGSDGTIAHAIERLFFIACEKAGYRWEMVAPYGYEFRRSVKKFSPNLATLFLRAEPLDPSFVRPRVTQLLRLSQ
jgi:O-antigen biosynthesis protein